MDCGKIHWGAGLIFNVGTTSMRTKDMLALTWLIIMTKLTYDLWCVYCCRSEDVCVCVSSF